MPKDATREEVARAYWRAWELGLKGVTIYRYGSKALQVMDTGQRSIPCSWNRVPIATLENAEYDIQNQPFLVCVSRVYPFVVHGYGQGETSHEISHHALDSDGADRMGHAC
jgi:hypothetical protein